ncbi:MAG: cell division protein FtsA, partial [Candidatus Acidiferrales bacterium]
MTKKERHMVALDIGSTKTCALIGELDDDGSVKFAAFGAAESKGWRKGQIVNLDLAVSSIRRAVEEAETIVGVPVESALIGVAGGHVRGVNSRGGITVGAKPRDIQRDDVRRAIEAARGVSLPEDREVLHVLPQEFFLDAQDNIRDAIGMVGQRLEANVHIVTASGTSTQNIVTAVNRAGVRVEDTVLEQMASAESCLTQDERELGVCLLDIGGGTTELIAYSGGVVRHTAAVPVGGDHFTNDLAVGLRTPIPEAEKIKREHGCAFREILGEDGAIEIASVGDRPPRTVYARMLSDIIEPRSQELLMLVRDDLRRGGMDSQVPA